MARKALPSNTEVLVALLQDARQFLVATEPLVHQFHMQDRLLKLAIEDPRELVCQSAFAVRLQREIDKNVAALGPHYEHMLDFIDFYGPTGARILDALNQPDVGSCQLSKSAENVRKLAGIHAAFDAMVAPIRRLYGEIMEKLADRPSPVRVDPPPSQPRITVFSEVPAVVLDSIYYPMKEGGAAFVQALLDAKGDWISSKEIVAKYPDLAGGTPIDKIRTRLPKPIFDLTKSKRGTGYQLRLE
jgi:hypothetical protein